MKQQNRPVKADEVLSIGGHTVFICYGGTSARNTLDNIQKILFSQKPLAENTVPEMPRKRP